MRVRLNEKKPYSHMCGEPGVAYLQDGSFYDRNGFYVRESGIPKPEAKPSVAARKREADMDLHARALERGNSVLNGFGNAASKQQKIMEDAERENLRALVAEERLYS